MLLVLVLLVLLLLVLLLLLVVKMSEMLLLLLLLGQCRGSGDGRACRGDRESQLTVAFLVTFALAPLAYASLFPFICELLRVDVGEGC